MADLRQLIMALQQQRLSPSAQMSAPAPTGTPSIQTQRNPISQVQQEAPANPLASGMNAAAGLNNKTGMLSAALRGMGGGATPSAAVTQGVNSTIGGMAPNFAGAGVSFPGAGGTVGAGASGALGALGPLAGAGLVAANAGRIGEGAGDLIERLGLKKTGLGNDARAIGDFVSGDFSSAWKNVKEGHLGKLFNVLDIF